ncbi:hypothetical protein [Algivirga pacifica]
MSNPTTKAIFYLASFVLSMAMCYYVLHSTRLERKTLQETKATISPIQSCDFIQQGSINRDRLYEHLLLAMTSDDMSSPWTIRWSLQNTLWNCGYMESHNFEDIVEELSGTSLLLEKDQYFNYYNPKIVRWCFKELIPEHPTIASIKLYRRYFRPWVRAYAQTYLYLRYTYNREEEVVSFQEAIQGNEDCHEYISKRYVSPLEFSENVLESNEEIMAFWMRREVDKTAEVLWEELERTLLIFDGEWITMCQGQWGRYKKIVAR